MKNRIAYVLIIAAKFTLDSRGLHGSVWLALWLFLSMLVLECL